jgi:hypothetical protein
LRTYLTILKYFPNKKYELLFASPKVNPATEDVISEYFSILERDFNDENTKFKYVSNENFNKDILRPTISISIKDSDTNELFIRSIILSNLFEKRKFVPLENRDRKEDVVNRYLNTNDELVLEFHPSDERVFKKELIKSKQASRTIFYKNGKTEPEIWNANNFTENSNLRGNIKSSSKYRRREELGIVKIKFEIIKRT